MATGMLQTPANGRRRAGRRDARAESPGTMLGGTQSSWRNNRRRSGSVLIHSQPQFEAMSMTPTTFTKHWLAAVAIGLACCLGCATSELTPSSLAGWSKSSAPDADAAKNLHDELPPKEAAKACMAAAEELEKGGHAEQAVFLYEKAQSHDPDLKTVSHRLAAIYDAQGDGVRALAEYQKALQSEPKNADLLNDFGYYHYRRQNFTEAESWFRKALDIEPNHAKVWTNLGLTLAELGRLDESFQAFSKAVGPAAAHSNLGVLLAKQGRVEQAKQEFHQALALDASLPQPKAFLAYLERRQ